ncbi:hypothetical protein T265_11738 [Opisthorchis viverrini]|uniref:Uncharacterized protein n=1 Tax=Opisthorchis viverrini TaxID=6198 RepID=A0A074YXI5_OPIVI|nr:hypothetical protein T265_11738 [Opisthorchis viverrini]KER19511.1 hypothetical protein T265_11738 [Opisthorchis viverrini]
MEDSLPASNACGPTVRTDRPLTDAEYADDIDFLSTNGNAYGRAVDIVDLRSFVKHTQPACCMIKHPDFNERSSTLKFKIITRARYASQMSFRKFKLDSRGGKTGNYIRLDVRGIQSVVTVTSRDSSGYH